MHLLSGPVGAGKEAGEGPEVQEDKAQTCGMEGKDCMSKTSREGEQRKLFDCNLEGKETLPCPTGWMESQRVLSPGAGRGPLQMGRT